MRGRPTRPGFGSGRRLVVAAYWHPIKAAGEAALLDLYRERAGAYQREFDRLHPGLKRTEEHW